MARRISDDTDRIPDTIEHPVTAKWDLSLTHDDYKKLLKGFQPRDMDDKWVCVTDAPDAQGNTEVHINRSWGNHKYITITVEAGNPDETEGDDWARFTSITWNSKTMGYLGEPVTEEEVKQDAMNFSRGLLGCKLSNAPTLYVYGD